MNIFKALDEVCEPNRATKYSSCVDLFAREDVVIGAGETKVVPLGVKIDEEKLNNIIRKQSKYLDGFNHVRWDIEYDIFKKSHCLELKCRRSLPLEKGLIIANGVDEIDLDYPDEIGILLHNLITEVRQEQSGDSECGTYMVDELYHEFNNDVKILKGEKIAQIKLVEHKSYLMGYESEEVRDGGFGSTDKVVVLKGSTPGKTRYEDIAHISSMLDDVAYQESKMEKK